MDGKSETTTRCGWHWRVEVCGYHVAIQLGRIAGFAVWPPGAWPKAPLVYRFIDCLLLKGVS